MAEFQLEINEQQRTFNVTRDGDRLHIESGDLSADVDATELANGTWSLTPGEPHSSGKQTRLAGTRDGDGRHLWINGRILEATRLRQQGVAPPIAAGSLSATIPAVVSEVLVAAGDQVAAGDKLILLESMKMVIPIEAPFAGRVVEINCAPGDSVAAGVPLAEIEADE